MQDRYIIQKGSNSEHCCFSHTVVDTTKPCLRYDGIQYLTPKGEPEYDPVCECFDIEEADLVCTALNNYNLRLHTGD